MPRGIKEAGEAKREVPMRVIVHGVQRTGSASMRTALHQLGLHNCYHMSSVVGNLDTDPLLWIQALEAKFGENGGKKWTREDWDQVLGQSQACLDIPTALFTLELAEAYPEAKIIMLNRDPEKWYDSVTDTVYHATKPRTLLALLQSMYCAALDIQHRNWVRFCIAVGKYGTPYDHGKEKDKALAWFKKSYSDVRDVIPEDRRFEFSVKDGFKPLCDFLGLPVPMIKDEQTGEMVVAPFPHVNDRASFGSRVAGSQAAKLRKANKRLFSLVSQAVTLSLITYGGYILWQTRLGGRF